MFSSHAYVEVDPNQADLMKTISKPIFNLLVADIVQFHDDKSLNKSLRGGYDGTNVSKLLLQVKSLKDDGAQTCRDIHASSSYCYGSISQWLNSQLAETKCVPYVLKSASELVKLLRSQSVFEGSMLVHLDIADFYMSGPIIELTRDCTRHIEDVPLRVLMRRALELILNQQFVVGVTSKDLYQVSNGTGMGLPHSSSVAGSAFQNLSEKDALHLAGGACIHGYYRYDDDILIHCSAWPKFICWFRSLKRNSKYFQLKIENVADDELVFLSLRITLNKQANSIDTAVYLKPACLARPLSCTSAHSHSLHMNWPVQFLKSLLHLCSSREVRVELRDEFVRRLKLADAHPDVILRCNSAVDLTRKSITGNDDAADAKDSKPVDLWLVLLYHHCLARGVARLLGKLNRCSTNRTFFQMGWSSSSRALEYGVIRVSWKRWHINMKERLQNIWKIDNVCWMTSDGGVQV